MSEFKIESGIPVPEHRKSHGKWKPLLASMKNGDSVVVPRDRLAGMHGAAKSLGIKIVTMATSATERRVWRAS